MLVKADGLAVAVVVVILDEDRVLAGLVAEDKLDVALGLDAKDELVVKELLGAVEPNDEVVALLVAETEERKVLLPAVDLFKVELDWNLEAEL